MTREELERDEQGIVSQLQQLQGALAYVRAKLKELEVREAKKSDAETPKEA